MNAPAGAYLPPAEQGLIVIHHSTTETVTNSTTLQNDDHFLLTMAANEVWVVEMHLACNITAASDIKFAWSLPTGGTFYFQIRGWVETGGLVTSEAGVTTTAYLVSALTRHVFIYTTITNGSTAGTAQFQWAQNTAVADNTQITSVAFMTAYLAQ